MSGNGELSNGVTTPPDDGLIHQTQYACDGSTLVCLEERDLQYRYPG
ncbi:MAG: hypothetical protein AB1758_15130 [Candidatus Eremiobacterota bacterium]